MSFFGDGREERMAAAVECMRLAAYPKVAARRKEYYRMVESARQDARSMLYSEVLERLIQHNPAYIRELLETEDERFGAGSLVERYARTFYKNY